MWLVVDVMFWRIQVLLFMREGKVGDIVSGTLRMAPRGFGLVILAV